MKRDPYWAICADLIAGAFVVGLVWAFCELAFGQEPKVFLPQAQPVQEIVRTDTQDCMFINNERTKFLNVCTPYPYNICKKYQRDGTAFVGYEVPMKECDIKELYK